MCFSIETIMLRSKNGINVVLILYNKCMGLLVGALKIQIPMPFEQQILFYVKCYVMTVESLVS